MPASYVVAGCRPWSREVFDRIVRFYPGHWEFVGTPEELTETRLAAIGPRYVFFLHWNWRVSDEIFNQYECVCFHMTDLPYGRGGSPLQNLILAGHRTTKLTALRMTDDLDAGPVYLKRDLDLQGSALEIYMRLSALAAAMILVMIESNPQPVPQHGPVTIFKRRRPEDSVLPSTIESAAEIYDFIRMLDADGYPRAFLDHGRFRHEYRNARMQPDGTVHADVLIRPCPEGGPV